MARVTPIAMDRRKLRDSLSLAMQTCAIIPARGGSKGIPHKNLQRVDGVPLIGRTIQAALGSKSIDRVFVSTDDVEIASAARAYGAEIIQRPAAISGDTASSESALLHGLDSLQENEAYVPDILVFLQCTSPFTSAEDIDGVVNSLLRERADSAFSAIPFHYFVWKQEPDRSAEGVNHDKRIRPRRQDREAQYLETGSVYAVRCDGFKVAKHRFFGKTVFYLTPPERAFEIDEPGDLLTAQALIAQHRTADLASYLPEKLAAVVFDFDGVMTDNRVFVSETGEETVACNRSDGLAIGRFRGYGVPLLVVSTETNPVVSARCRKLKIECLHGYDRKVDALKNWAGQAGVSAQGIVYLGNDRNDVECLHFAGCGVATGDAYPEAIAAAKFKLQARGGDGAVRELLHLLESHYRLEPKTLESLKTAENVSPSTMPVV